MRSVELVDTALATPMRVPERTARLLAAMGSLGHGAGVDAMLITDTCNLRYLTGFTGGAALLAVTRGGLTLVTDGRYGDRVHTDLAAAGVDARIEVTHDCQREAIVAAVGTARRIGLEADSVTWAQQRRYAREWFASRDVVPTAGLVERLRFVKDEGELARIRAAVSLADNVLTELKSILEEGPAEHDFRELLDDQMRLLGSEEPACPTVVASGPNAAIPGHRSSPRRITDGDLVRIEFGGTIDGYRSELSRTFMVGEVSMEARAMYDLVLQAQAAGIASVHDGVAAADVDGACRSVIETAGRGEQFTHASGHGIGLYIHEHPVLARTSMDILGAGHIVTVAPALYVPGVGGVRIEDLLIVTAAGCESLTHMSKSPAPA